LVAVHREGPIPLSFAQQRLWFINQFEQGQETIYNMPMALDLNEALLIDDSETVNVAHVIHALNLIVVRHESLRTTFSTVDDEAVQVIAPTLVLDIPVRTVGADEAVAHVKAHAEQVFDLTKGPVISAVLLNITGGTSLLLVNVHHIAFDGVSMAVLEQEFIALYRGLVNFSGDKEQALAILAPLTIQYADYAHWQRQCFSPEALRDSENGSAQQLQYWQQTLASAPALLELPYDKARPAIQHFEGSMATFTVPKALQQQLKVLTSRYGVTTYMATLAVFKLLLARYSGQCDIVVGSPVANRTRPALEPMIGFFVNNIVLRSTVDESLNFVEFLADMKETTLSAQQHSDVPFDALVQALNPLRSLSYSPLFQVAFSLVSNVTAVSNDIAAVSDVFTENEAPAIEGDTHDSHKVSRFDITLNLTEHNDGISGQIEYSTALFDASTMARLCQHYLHLITDVVAAPEKMLSQHSLLNATELAALLTDEPQELSLAPVSCLHQLFEQQAALSPSAIALSYEGQTLSYDTLNRLANRVARHLVQSGVRTETAVGLHTDRSLGQIVGVLAIVKAGGYYVPLPPDLPDERLLYISQDSGVEWVLSQSLLTPLSEIAGEGQIKQVIYLDTFMDSINGVDEALESNLDVAVSPENLAYAIYTSGSTGKPKGTLIPHSNVHHLFMASDCHFGFGAKDVWTLFHSYAFDFSVWEIWGALIYGGRLVIVASDTMRDPNAFYQLLLNEKVTVLNQTPSAFNGVISAAASNLASRLTTLRAVIFGGEALVMEALRPWFNLYDDEQVQLVNMYGITETTVHVTYQRVTLATLSQAGSSVIGRSLSHLRTFVLDANRLPVPMGIAGELYVGGKGLARAYLGKPALTAARFITHQFTPEQPAQRLYRSGDLVRAQRDGTLDYLGRIDAQVKVRGFRIELGEIEAALQQQAGVDEVVVITHDSDYLVAYVVGDVDIDTLRTGLKRQLPDYMMPAFILKLSRLPLTINGKVDRKALLPPSHDEAVGGDYQAPTTAFEHQAVAIWQTVLGRDVVGVNDDYFHLGGDSIRVMQLISQMNREMDLSLQIKDVFLAPSIRALETLMSETTLVSIDVERDAGLVRLAELKLDIEGTPEMACHLPAQYEDFYPLANIQQGMVLFTQLRPNEPLYHDQFTFPFDDDAFDFALFKQALLQIMSRHSMLRTGFETQHFYPPIQIVYPEAALSVAQDTALVDLSVLEVSAKQAALDAYMAADLANKFQFDGSLLWRISVIKIDDSTHFMFLSFQHAILDGWSVSRLWAEVVQRYQALTSEAGTTQAVTIPLLAYKDHVAIEIGRRTAPQAQAFWHQLLDNHTRTKLPFNYSDHQVSEETGMQVKRVTLSPQRCAEIAVVAQANRCSFKDVCVSAYVYLMHLITAEEDIVTGLVSHSRPALEGSEAVLGNFLNTVPLRIGFDVVVNKAVLLSQVTQLIRQLKTHELFLGDIAQIAKSHNHDGNPLFDCLFNYTEFDHVDTEEGLEQGLEAVDIEGAKEHSGISQPDSAEMTNTLFDLEVHRLAVGAIVQLKYVPSHFHESEMYTAIELYLGILAQFSDTSACFEQEALLGQTALTELASFNETKASYSEALRLHELFEAQVVAQPDAIALVSGERDLSYQALNERANQVACLVQSELARLGKSGNNSVSPGELVNAVPCVGLMLHRDIELIVCVLGILKAGAAYVPIDPDYPLARVQTIVDNANITVMLSDIASDVSVSSLVRIDEVSVAHYPTVNVISRTEVDDLAYVIYTSGSTGTPKGVMISHRSAVNLINWVNTRFDVGPRDNLLFVTSICFDLSVYDVFGLLGAGGRVTIATKEAIQDPNALVALMQNENITFWDAVPTTMNHLVNALQNTQSHKDQSLMCLRLVFMSGDWIPVQLPGAIKRHCPNAEVISLGGATEAAVWSCFYPIEASMEGKASVPYGRPIANNTFYVLDKAQRMLPKGVTGDLYIGGIGVAQGYQGDKERTDAAFFIDTVGTDELARIEGKDAIMYRTGDMGRFLPDGTMEFLGRQDHQVKIRGYRVELGDIEHALSQDVAVKDAVVKVHKREESQELYLVAYAALMDGVAVSGSEMQQSLISSLRERLPDYMVPAFILLLDAMPLNASGKIDRGALLAPELGDMAREEKVAPSTETEQLLAEIWAHVLDLPVEQLSVHDEFFNLGGNSLAAITIVQRIDEYFAIALPLKVLFSGLDLETIAQQIDQKQLQLLEMLDSLEVDQEPLVQHMLNPENK
jgi:tyrocidine synthetase-3